MNLRKLKKQLSGELQQEWIKAMKLLETINQHLRQP